jgi:hypothetical protein
MAFGVSSKKIACTYLADDATVYQDFHTQDVMTAGGFMAGTSSNMKPSRGSFKPRHVRLVSSDGLHRASVPIANSAVYVTLEVNASFNYAGMSWRITSTEGEKTVSRP